MPTDQPPHPVPRPKLARFLWDRKLNPANVAPVLGVSLETVRRWCLEFGNPDRSVPNDEAMEKIVAYTAGAVTAADFYPPHLNGETEPGSSDRRGGDPETLRLARAS